MTRTIRSNTDPVYSLHDMTVTALDIADEDVIMRTQSGMIKTTPPYPQPDGYIEFHNVRWDYSYAYLLDFTGNVGKFTGEKMFLRDFIAKALPLGFTVMDETYGYNTAKYDGYLSLKGKFYVCMLEIYHEGDMVFVAEE